MPRLTHSLFVAIAAAGCAHDADAVTGDDAEIVAADRGVVQLTHYTLALESDFESRSDFLCSGHGVAMQGTGLNADGTYVKYVAGGGGWCGGFARLCDCGSARFTQVDHVFGASGRALVKHYSIAVDPSFVPLGSSVWLSELGHWFRADDTGGAIVGAHFDVYTETPDPTIPSTSRAFVTDVEHAPDDPGPNGEAPSTPSTVPSTTSDRPQGGPFEALDVRAPTEAGGFVTQCNTSGDAERVWSTTGVGRTTSSRWAEARYPEATTGACGDAVDGRRPLVFRSEPADALGGAWITQCAIPGVTHVYRVTALVDDHPAAPFHHDEEDASCTSISGDP